MPWCNKPPWTVFSNPDIDHCFRFWVLLLHLSHAINPLTFQVSTRWQNEQLTKCYCTRHECPVLQKLPGKQLTMPVSSVFIFVCFKLSQFKFYGLVTQRLLKLTLKIILQETKLESKVNSVRRGDNKQKKKKNPHALLFQVKTQTGQLPWQHIVSLMIFVEYKSTFIW